MSERGSSSRGGGRGGGGGAGRGGRRKDDRDKPGNNRNANKSKSDLRQWKVYTSSKRAVGGPGIYVTCVRGREGRAVGEVYDLLEDIADEIYPPERVAALELTRQVKGGGSKAEQASEQEDGVRMEDEDSADEDEDEDVEESIEESIARELAQIKAGFGKKGKGKATGEGGETKEEKKKEKHRFLSVATATDCLLFISVAWPYDPLEIVQSIVKRVQLDGVARTRNLMRLEPVIGTCHASTTSAIEKLSTKIIENAFVKWSEDNNTTTITYQIEPSIRCHDAPLTRDSVLSTIGTIVRSLSSAPTESSPNPTRPILSVSANLKTPDLVVIPTVWRNCFGVSVVEGKLWTGKRFNIEAIAADFRKRQVAAEEAEKLKDGAGSVEEYVVVVEEKAQDVDVPPLNEVTA